MEEKEKLLSEEHLDFLREMMNVGAGNAVTALSTMLQCGVDLRIPGVHVLAAPRVPPQVLDDPSLPVACVRMRMVGKVTGDLFFIVPDNQKVALIRLAERASGMRDSEFGMQNGTPQSAIQNPQSAICNPQSAICNPQSPAPQSAIRNPQSPAPQSAISNRLWISQFWRRLAIFLPGSI